MRWSEEEFAAYQAKRGGREKAKAKPIRRGNKYRNCIVEIDGMRFDSKGEAARYHRRQVEYRLDIPNPVAGDGKVCAYRADFVYVDEDGDTVTEDFKGVVTDAYRIKRAMMRALHGVEILETHAKRRALGSRRIRR